MSKPDSQNIASMDFEQAMAELEAIVRQLESGEVSLEDSITAYTRGTELRQHCQKRLEEARLKVEKLTQKTDGTMQTEPFEAS